MELGWSFLLSGICSPWKSIRIFTRFFKATPIPKAMFFGAAARSKYPAMERQRKKSPEASINTEAVTKICKQRSVTGIHLAFSETTALRPRLLAALETAQSECMRYGRQRPCCEVRFGKQVPRMTSVYRRATYTSICQINMRRCLFLIPT